MSDTDMINKLRAVARQMADANMRMDSALSLLEELKEDTADLDVPWDEYKVDLFGVNELLRTNYQDLKKKADEFRASMLEIYTIRIEKRLAQLKQIANLENN